MEVSGGKGYLFNRSVPQLTPFITQPDIKKGKISIFRSFFKRSI